MRLYRSITIALFALTLGLASAADAADSAMVQLAGSPIFAVSGANGLSSAERAEVINQRLEKWLADPRVPLRVEAHRKGPALKIGDDTLIIVSNEDARLNGASADELAAAWSKRLSAAAESRLASMGTQAAAWDFLQGLFLPILTVLGLLAGGATAAWLINWGATRIADNPRRYGLPVTGAAVTLVGAALSLAVGLIASLLALSYLPFQSWIVMTAAALLGATGLIASADALANAAGGTLLAFNPVFKEGDRIRLGGRAGRVTRVGKLFTRLETERHGERLVPNGALLRRGVALLPPEETPSLLVPVRLAYTVQRDLAQAIVLEAALRTHGVSDEPLPECLLSELEDEAIRYELRAELMPGARLEVVTSHFHINLLEVLAENDLGPGGAPLARATLRIGMAALDPEL